MPDKQVHPIGTENAPADYTIPSSAELLLKSIHAKYDGSGAAGDFVPLIRIISNGGSTTDEIPQDTTIAAGASADATWFPRVGAAAAKAGGTFQWCRVVCGPAQPSGPIGSPSSGTAMPIDTFSTSDPANYTQVDAFTWTIPAVPQIACGYIQVDGGGLTVLNGDVYCVAQKLGGGLVGAYGQNTHKLLIEWFALNLTRGLEIGGTWEAFAAGADTHNFDLVITYGAVY